MFFIHARPSEKVFLEAARKLESFLNEVSGPILFLSSGGSALKLADEIKISGSARHYTLTVVDERWTTHPDYQNYAHFEKTDLFQSIMTQGGKSISPLPQNNESREISAQRWEDALRNWVKENPEGKIIATLGMGEDGHIAGIFPDEQELFRHRYDANDKWVVDHTYEDAPQCRERITVTLSFLRQTDRAVMVVSGRPKQKAFDQLVNNKSQLHQLPAGIIHSLSEVHCFTDLIG